MSEPAINHWPWYEQHIKAVWRQRDGCYQMNQIDEKDLTLYCKLYVFYLLQFWGS